VGAHYPRPSWMILPWYLLVTQLLSQQRCPNVTQEVLDRLLLQVLKERTQERKQMRLLR